MLGSATKVAKVAGVDPVSEAEDQTLDWKHTVTLMPGENATVSSFTSFQCNINRIVLGDVNNHPDCTPGTLVFSPESGFVHAQRRLVLSSAPIISEGQGFFVSEGAENGYVIGKLDMQSPRFTGAPVDDVILLSAV